MASAELPMTNYVQWRVALTTEPYAATPSWTDISTDIRHATWERMRGGPERETFPSTTTWVVDNRDGQWDPNNPASSSPYGSNVKRNRLMQMRVRKTPVGSWVNVGVWFLDDVRIEGNSKDSVAILTGSDILRVLQDYPLSEVSRSAELTGDRVDGILDLAGVPTAWRTTRDSGTVMMPEATLTGSALQFVQEAVRAELGQFYSGNAGLTNFLNRYRRTVDTNQTVVQRTIDDAWINHAASVRHTIGGFHSVSSVLVSDGTRSATYDVTGANDVQTLDLSLSVPILHKADLQAHAEALQKMLEFSDARVDRLTLDVVPWRGATSNALNMLGDQDIVIGFRHQVDWRPLGWSSDYQYGAVVEGMVGDVSPSSFTLEVHYSPYSTTWVTAAADFYTVGDTVAGTDTGGL